jgi:transcription initiation factor TFIIIB Brf1 subunit/transcription initiation factor TFIIB
MTSSSYDIKSDIWNNFTDFDNIIDNSTYVIDNMIDNISIDSLGKQLSFDEYQMDICSDCKAFSLVYKDGQYVCTKCGLMQHKMLSEEAEYRYYTNNDNNTRGSNPERVGMATNSMLPESSLGTMIAKRGDNKSSIKKMIQYNSWHQMPYKERSLYRICTKITNLCKQAGIANIIIERAKELYNTIRDVNTCRGDNRDSIIAACVYFACKDEKVPRSSKEIATIFQIELHDMTKGIKYFRDIWRLANKRNENIHMESSNPIDYIERYCSELHVDEYVRHISEYIAIKSMFFNYVEDNTTPSIAAGSIYIACHVTGQNIIKKNVAEACKTSEVTISKCFKKLYPYFKNILPKSIYENYIENIDTISLSSKTSLRIQSNNNKINMNELNNIFGKVEL